MEIALKVGPAFTDPPPDLASIFVGIAFVAVTAIAWVGTLAIIDRTT